MSSGSNSSPGSNSSSGSNSNSGSVRSLVRFGFGFGSGSVRGGVFDSVRFDSDSTQIQENHSIYL